MYRRCWRPVQTPKAKVFCVWPKMLLVAVVDVHAVRKRVLYDARMSAHMDVVQVLLVYR